MPEASFDTAAIDEVDSPRMVSQETSGNIWTYEINCGDSMRKANGTLQSNNEKLLFHTLLAPGN
jgi:hypothetical protein